MGSAPRATAPAQFPHFSACRRTFMRIRIVWSTLVLLAASAIAGAQTATTTTDERLDRLERRLAELEQKHQAELKARDEEIGKLKSELSQRRAAATQPAAGVPADEIEKAKQDVLRDIESGAAAPIEKRIAASF